jgi:hypothetical protein
MIRVKPSFAEKQRLPVFIEKSTELISWPKKIFETVDNRIYVLPRERKREERKEKKNPYAKVDMF